MSAIGLRRRLVHGRRHLAVMAAVLVIVAAIAVHHSAIATGAMHHDHAMSAAIELCIAVMTAVARVIALGVLGRWRAARLQRPSRWRSRRASPLAGLALDHPCCIATLGPLAVPMKRLGV